MQNNVLISYFRQQDKSQRKMPRSRGNPRGVVCVSLEGVGVSMARRDKKCKEKFNKEVGVDLARGRIGQVLPIPHSLKKLVAKMLEVRAKYFKLESETVGI